MFKMNSIFFKTSTKKLVISNNKLQNFNYNFNFIFSKNSVLNSLNSQNSLNKFHFSKTSIKSFSNQHNNNNKVDIKENFHTRNNSKLNSKYDSNHQIFSKFIQSQHIKDVFEFVSENSSTFKNQDYLETIKIILLKSNNESNFYSGFHDSAKATPNYYKNKTELEIIYRWILHNINNNNKIFGGEFYITKFFDFLDQCNLKRSMKLSNSIIFSSRKEFMDSFEGKYQQIMSEQKFSLGFYQRFLLYIEYTTSNYFNFDYFRDLNILVKNPDNFSSISARDLFKLLITLKNHTVFCKANKNAEREYKILIEILFNMNNSVHTIINSESHDKIELKIKLLTITAIHFYPMFDNFNNHKTLIIQNMLNLVESIRKKAKEYKPNSLSNTIEAFNELHDILIDVGLEEDPKMTIVKEAIIELDSIMSLKIQQDVNAVTFPSIYNFIAGLSKTKGKYTTKENVVLYLDFLLNNEINSIDISMENTNAIIGLVADLGIDLSVESTTENKINKCINELIKSSLTKYILINWYKNDVGKHINEINDFKLIINHIHNTTHNNKKFLINYADQEVQTKLDSTNQLNLIYLFHKASILKLSQETITKIKNAFFSIYFINTNIIQYISETLIDNTAFIEEFIQKIKVQVITNNYMRYIMIESLIHIKILKKNNKVIVDDIDSIIDLLFENLDFRKNVLFYLLNNLNSKLYMCSESYIELYYEKILMMIQSIIQKIDNTNTNDTSTTNFTKTSTSVVYPMSDFIEPKTFSQILKILINIDNMNNHLEQSTNKNLILTSTLQFLTSILNNLPNKNFFDNFFSLSLINQIIVIFSKNNYNHEFFTDMFIQNHQTWFEIRSKNQLLNRLNYIDYFLNLPVDYIQNNNKIIKIFNDFENTFYNEYMIKMFYIPDLNRIVHILSTLNRISSNNTNNNSSKLLEFFTHCLTVLQLNQSSILDNKVKNENAIVLLYSLSYYDENIKTNSLYLTLLDSLMKGKYSLDKDDIRSIMEKLSKLIICLFIC